MINRMYSYEQGMKSIIGMLIEINMLNIHSVYVWVQSSTLTHLKELQFHFEFKHDTFFSP